MFWRLVDWAVQVSGVATYVGAALLVLAAVGYGIFTWHRRRLQDGKRGVENWHIVATFMGGAGVFLIIGTGVYVWMHMAASAPWMLPPEAIEKSVPDELINAPQDMQKRNVDLIKLSQGLNQKILESIEPERSKLLEQQRKLQSEIQSTTYDLIPSANSKIIDYMIGRLKRGVLVARGQRILIESKGQGNVDAAFVEIRPSEWQRLTIVAPNYIRAIPQDGLNGGYASLEIRKAQ